MNQRTYTIPLIITLLLLATACDPGWKEYYDDYPDTVNKKVWDELKNDQAVSLFIGLLEEYEYDTLFNSDIAYTLFIPGNDALESYLAQHEVTDYYLGYHLTPLIIQSGNLSASERFVQTLSKKYIRFQRSGSAVTIDGVPAAYESPLFLDGKYYVLDDVIEPLPNLYEYFKVTNSVLSDYIDTQDSIILDKNLSIPIGFDDFGRTIYDTVSDVINIFEEEYFTVKQEDRSVFGTIVFPKAEDYNQALNTIADALGPSIVDYRDIPLEWQHEVLLPYLFKKGIFLNKIEQVDFPTKIDSKKNKMLNILGDSIVIDYIPAEKAVCSNGYAYNYTDFSIPDELYLGTATFEMETLLDETGINRFAWNEAVQIESGLSVLPKQVYINTASNDSLIWVEFPKKYNGTYSVQFKGPRLFPRKYLMVVSTNMDYGGIYDIYVNGELATTFDYTEFLLYRGVIYGVTGERYLPDGRYNKFDMLVENIDSYDRVDIKFEYMGPGNVANNGLVMDALEFIPVND
ncbi:MAG: fasciclin domain-containing protein [Bacteroidota bacterium]